MLEERTTDMLSDDIITEINDWMATIQDEEPRMPEGVLLAYAMFETLKSLDSGRDWYDFLERSLNKVVSYTDMLDPVAPEQEQVKRTVQ